MSFFERLFGKNAKEHFLNFTPEGSTWRVVSWNFDLKDPSARQWTIELSGEKNLMILWERQKWDVVRFFQEADLLSKRNMGKKNPELISLMNLAIHSTLKHALEKNYQFMLTPVSGATAIDIQNEAKALQWIQATFGTLTRALDKIKMDPQLILTAACFSGTVPESEEEVFRVIAFNLDIFFYLRPDYSLQIVIFNDKDQGHGESKSPSFQQTIKVTKPQFYDEITRLVHRLAQIGEIH